MKILRIIVILALAVIAAGLLALCVHAVGLAGETGGALAVVIAVYLAFNGKNKSRRFLKYRFYAPPFAIIVFIFGLSGYFALLEVITT